MSEPQAAVTAPPAEPVVKKSTDRQEWLLKGHAHLVGKEIDEKTGKEVSSTSKPAKAAEAGADGKTSESGTDKKADQEKNWKALREKAERAEALERENADLKSKLAAPKDEKKAEPSAADKKEPAKAEGPKPPAKPAYPARPTLAQSTSQEEYEDKLFAWRDECKSIDEKHSAAEKAFNDAKAQFEQRQKDLDAKLRAGIERVNTKYPDGKETQQRVFEQLTKPGASTPEIDWFLNNTEVLPDLLYVLGGKEDEKFKLDALFELGRKSPAQALDLLYQMQRDIRAELAGGKKAEESKADEKKDDEKPPEEKSTKKVTSALPPPREVGGKGTAAEDPIKAASARRDTRTYMRLANERDLAKKRGK